LVAATLNLYVVPAIKFVTIKEELVYAKEYSCQFPVPLSQTILYPVTADPPSLAGAVQLNATWVLLVEVVSIVKSVGGPGTLL
jgi:hypothetical protein